MDTNLKEVYRRIKKMKPNTNGGTYNIANEMFIHARYQLGPIFVSIFKCIFKKYIYPKCWTTRIVAPIQKSRDKIMLITLVVLL